VEDYAKAIYMLERRAEGGPVATNDLAERIGVTAASVSGMLKRLEQAELVAHVPYRGVTLTPRGVRIALEMIRHHRLLELYLVQELGLPWDRVHDEAEVLEHVLSDELEELIAAKLGNPEVDPHGDPIPTCELEINEPRTLSLGALEPGAAGTFVRVSDSEPAMLRYLADCEIRPGDRFEVLDKQPFDGPLLVRFGDSVHSLGGALVRAMRVELST
jgi:DtxR family Mn-dependent transcriptional regulator